ncbi:MULTISPECIES: WXG100 family type VII secretion target [Corynebacterium]|uniref:ESAT-6-like protein n=1 Tax=Corynebacterium freneyi TaxID=134034 RepID=A0ABS4UAE8_9CORY|nr:MULTISPECIES: WXG100 family type VII secretion target [Corynebacterium]MBP2333526.1 WXG100 family type VII secretion target [Corynebacterium freneyi]OFU54387.1 secretion protein [Corynebacterium sp. HMSC11E11]QXA52447.1 WXG100 family type VII secretion target [Corynebacterium freneyi]WJZ04371.1 6 kDa early secretory antigenic target [Corynebacterium freneyi]
MTDTIRYQFGSIATGAADIRTTSGHIQTLLGDLKTRIAPMTATWEGESAIAYEDAQRAWDESAEELNQILETIARTVEEGNDRMSDINRRAAASWG